MTSDTLSVDQRPSTVLCNMFSLTAMTWTSVFECKCLHIYLRSIGWMVFHWISLRSSYNNLLQNSNIISMSFFNCHFCCIKADHNLVDPSNHGHHAMLPQPQSSQMQITQHSMNFLSNARLFKLFTHDGHKKTLLTQARILLW